MNRYLLFKDEMQPLSQPLYSLFPRPLSAWKGERKPMSTNEGGISLIQRKALFDTKKRPLPIEEGVSFCA
ncbi:hypothetical protein PRBRB14_12560 [Hallella multisaccharivorax DSM 17128]|uniref:Uncharacterized protein n=1 Tax=Hallella multisaccharivorax DSM 17128 TaxID=688246 RepID=F8NAU4_9BACT|nr:hypothetical protein [Hallella multisaccharivorax]EGN56842.1 hypothetical protein Premu_1415 [Hallella multisaccharivorax DSM 17128]GJG30377.1 hypothetical protein PRBRB14_12560 [Hallella multisaccharivorax DSM 17128]